VAEQEGKCGSVIQWHLALIIYSRFASSTATLLVEGFKLSGNEVYIVKSMMLDLLGPTEPVDVLAQLCPLCPFLIF
jgi:hypothetical protein